MNGFYCHKMFDDGHCQGWIGTPDEHSNTYHAWITDGLNLRYIKQNVPALTAVVALLDMQLA